MDTAVNPQPPAINGVESRLDEVIELLRDVKRALPPAFVERAGGLTELREPSGPDHPEELAEIRGRRRRREN